MNKNTIRRIATTTLAAAMIATPAIAMAQTNGQPVGITTLPAHVGEYVTITTLPHQLTEAELAGIVTLPADLTEAEIAGVVTLPGTIDRSDLVRPVAAAVDPELALAGTIESRDDEGNLVLTDGDFGRNPLARGGLVEAVTLPATIDPQPVVVDEINPDLGIVAISIDISDELFVPISLDEEGTIEYRDEDGNLVAPEFENGFNDLARTLYDNDVTPATVDDLDPELGIMPISIDIEPISGELDAAEGLSAASVSGIAAGVTVLVAGGSYLVARKSRKA